MVPNFMLSSQALYIEGHGSWKLTLKEIIANEINAIWRNFALSSYNKGLYHREKNHMNIPNHIFTHCGTFVISNLN